MLEMIVVTTVERAFNLEANVRSQRAVSARVQETVLQAGVSFQYLNKSSNTTHQAVQYTTQDGRVK